MLTAPSEQYLAQLKDDPKFQQLVKELEAQAPEKAPRPWNPDDEKPLTLKEVIQTQSLHEGYELLLSQLRG